MIKNNNNYNQAQLDTTDEQIIKKLQTDGRKSYRQIATELDLSVGTITNRIQKLQNNKIIKGFQLELDYQKLGYNIETIIELEAKESIDNLLKQYPNNIITALKTTGKYDMLLITRFKDTTELNTFLKKINQEENVKKTNTRLILDNIGT